MTSGNVSDEPIAYEDDEARARLGGIADAFLMHDRDIVVRCDDSVVRVGPAFIRRARGYVPVPITLANGGPTVLALGGLLRNGSDTEAADAAYLAASEELIRLAPNYAAAQGYLGHALVKLGRSEDARLFLLIFWAWC